MNLGSEFSEKLRRVYEAVDMWQHTFVSLCNENKSTSDSHDYSVFITNAGSTDEDMHQVVLDFYDYFYTNQHICDVNTIHRTLDTFDNNYGLGPRTNVCGIRSEAEDIHAYSEGRPKGVRRNMNVLDMLRTLKTRSDHQGGGLLTVFSQITLYTFTLCIRLRTELRLPSLDGYKDVYIVKYLTRIDVGEDNNDIEN